MELQKLEEERLTLLQSYKKKSEIGFILLAVGLLASFIFGFILFTDSKVEAVFVIGLVTGIILVFAASVFLGMAGSENRKYSKRIKGVVIKQILDGIYKDATYDQSKSINVENMLSMGLFPRPDRYHGEDYYSGEFDGIKFETSELTLERRVSHSDSKGHMYYTYEPYFIGRYILFTLPRKFDDSILIRESQFLDGFNLTGLKKVETESIEFNKKFKIYSTNEEFFFYMITPLFMDHLLTFEQNHVGQIYAAFKHNSFHFALDDKKNHFEFNIKTPLTNEGLMGVTKDLMMPKDIIEDLRFNTSKFQNQ